MFNVSFNVSDEKLTTALTALHTMIKDWGGNSLQAAPLDENAIVNAEATLTVPNTPRPKRAYKKRESKPVNFGLGTQLDRAAFIISQIGIQPFDIKEVKKRAKRLGVQDTALYNTLKLEREAGRIVHLGYGKWQRTGAGFANSLGFNAEAVNQ